MGKIRGLIATVVAVCSFGVGVSSAMTPAEAEKALGMKDLKAVSVKETVIKGVYEVYVTAGNQRGLILIGGGGKYILQGQIINIKTKQPVVEHTKEFPPRKVFQGVDVKKIPVENAVIIGNKNGKDKVYVFTDPDCPYCRAIHPALGKLVEAMPDAKIYIMLMPIPSLHPQAYDKARYLMSHKDDMKALDAAFSGKPVPKPIGDEGKAGVDAVMKFAAESGINGTPTVLGPDGKVMAGGASIESMKEALKK